MLAYRLVFCFGARVGNQSQYVSVDDWLGPQPEIDPSGASGALLRRYLSCNGPSTVDDFREWSGMAPTDALRAWRGVEGDLVDVAMGRRRAWLAAEDLV